MSFTLTESTPKPTWVKQLVAFNPDFQRDTEKPFNVVKTQVTDVGEITILSNSPMIALLWMNTKEFP